MQPALSSGSAVLRIMGMHGFLDGLSQVIIQFASIINFSHNLTFVFASLELHEEFHKYYLRIVKMLKLCEVKSPPVCVLVLPSI